MRVEIRTLLKCWLLKLKLFHINIDPLLCKINIFTIFVWFGYIIHNILYSPFKYDGFL